MPMYTLHHSCTDDISELNMNPKIILIEELVISINAT